MPRTGRVALPERKASAAGRVRVERAKVSATTRSQPPERSARAQAPSVAPVVTTSSTRTAARAASREAHPGRGGQRSARGRPTCRLPCERRRQGRAAARSARARRDRLRRVEPAPAPARRSGRHGDDRPSSRPAGARRRSPRPRAGERQPRAELERHHQVPGDPLVGRGGPGGVQPRNRRRARREPASPDSHPRRALRGTSPPHTAQRGGTTRPRSSASIGDDRRPRPRACGAQTVTNLARRIVQAPTTAQSKTARSTAPTSASQPITPGALPSAVSGSLRPWPVSTQTTDVGRLAALRRRQPVSQDPGHRRRRGGLAEDALARGEQAVGVEDLLVGDRGDPPPRAGDGVHRLLPARRVADPDRRGDRLRLGDRLAVDQRGGALRLEAVQDRRRPVLLEAPPPGGDVAGVADRDRERVGWPAELVAGLERGRLLALDPVRVDRVDQLDRVAPWPARARSRAPGRSCRAARSPAPRASAPGRACRSRSSPPGRSPRRAGRPAPRRPRRSPPCSRWRRR